MDAYEKLTPKQRAFVEAYLVSGNATRAYQEAGYKGNVNLAGVEGQRNLRKPKIQQALAARRAQLASAYDVTPERVTHELALIAFADMHQYATWGPAGVTLRDSEAIDAEARRVVGEVSQRSTEAGGTIKFKLHSKLDALDKLAKKLKLYGDTEALEQLGQGLMGLLTQQRQGAANGQHPRS
jgi:phage terminase small subunit